MSDYHRELVNDGVYWTTHSTRKCAISVAFVCSCGLLVWMSSMVISISLLTGHFWFICDGNIVCSAEFLPGYSSSKINKLKRMDR